MFCFVNEICILAINSFLEIDPEASAIFAPTDVPDRSNCLLNTNSFSRLIIVLYSSTTLIAN